MPLMFAKRHNYEGPVRASVRAHAARSGTGAVTAARARACEI